MHSPYSAGQGSGQSLGRLRGTTHRELDLLVDLAGQAPGLILRPHEVRFLKDLCRRAVPSQSGCVSECFDRAGEQQHRPVRDLHPRRLRSRRRRAYPALPYRRIPLGSRGRVGGEGREGCAKDIGRWLAWRVIGIRLGILGKCDTHIHVKAWWAVTDKIPPINIGSQQPSRRVRVCSGPYLRHSHQSGATHPPVTVVLGCRRSPRWCDRLCRVRPGGQGAVEFGARGDVEFGEYLAQVVGDGGGADEQPGADLGVGQAVAG